MIRNRTKPGFLFGLLLSIALQTFSLPPLIPFRKVDKWGYVNPKGEMVISPIYDYASQISNGYGQLSLNKKFALIDSTGKFLTEFLYESHLDFIPMSENLSWVKKNSIPIIITIDGKEIIPKFQYKEYESFHNGYAVVKRNNKFGFVNKNGEEIIPCIYDSCGYASYNKLFRVKNKGKWGYIDIESKVRIDFKFKYVYKFIKGIAIVGDTTGKFGFINEEGTIVIPIKYDWVWLDDNGYYGFRVKKKSGLLNSKGKIVFPAKYEYVNASGKDIFVCTNGSKNEIYDKKLRRIFYTEKFKDIDTFREGLAAVTTFSGKEGFINKKGKLVIDTIFGSVHWFFEGFADVSISPDKEGYKPDNEGYINKKGEIVIPCIYEYTGFFRDGLVVVRRDDKWFYIDKTGKEYIDWD